MSRKLISLLFQMIAALMLGGCSSLSGMIFGPPTTSLKAVRIVAMAESNHNQPTRIDLVFVYDQSLSASLPKSAREWFRQKAALQGAYPQKLDAVSFELPPISEVAAQLPDRYDDALSVLVYADYQSPAGQNVADLTFFKHPVIRLKAESFAISEQP